ncbi:MAG: DNA translocase FtsK [bacterium]
MSRYHSMARNDGQTPALLQLGQTIRGLVLRAGGVSLVFLALWALIAIAGFSISDPSWNTATDRAVTNPAGFIGAALADVLLQFIGGAAIFLPIPIMIWGVQAVRFGPVQAERTPLSAWSRFFAWIAGISTLAGLASLLPVAVSWPFVTTMGGVFGGLIGDMALAPFRALHIPFAEILVGIFLLAVSLRFLSHACGIRREQIDEAWSAMLWLYDEARYRLDQLVETILNKDEQSDEEYEYIEVEEEIDEEAEDGVEQTPLVASADERLPVEEEKPKRKIHERKKKRAIRKEVQPDLPVFSAGNYKLPSLNLMAKPPRDQVVVPKEVLHANARALESVLSDFGVRGEIIDVRPGPVVTLYELEPAAGVKSSRVINLADDIARSMSAVACRVAVVPGRNVIGIELPNTDREFVYFRETLSTPEFDTAKGALTLSLGKDIGGEAVYADLSKMPHLLIAGTTGSGKSVGINTMILSLLYRMPPDQCKMIMVDPKMLELSVYEGIPHLLAPVVTDPHKAVVALKWTVKEMEERYRQMSKVGVRNITGFNERVREAENKGETLTRTVHTGYDKESGEPVYETEELDYQPMPFIVVIIDEVADLMMVAGKDIEGMVQRLAQMARAAGIHLIMATQRPSVDVITGTIKANFPTRISFQVTSKIDSRTILGEQGAEQLLGMGDMLYMAGGGRLQRVHGAFVSDDEVEKIVAHLKKQGKPDYVQEVTEMSDDNDPLAALSTGGNTSSGDALYDQALAIVLRDKKASTSYIQRRLSIGYNRAATLIERLEQEGIISAANHAGKREILIESNVA